MNVGISGSSGFIGWHVRARLLREADITILPLRREEFGNPELLERVLQKCDAIVHLAGGRLSESDEEDYAQNMALTETLFKALSAQDRSLPVLFMSSISAVEKQNGYGRAKRDGAALAHAWGERTATPVEILVPPNVIGEFAQPDHHTVVATFCRDIANGRESHVNHEGKVELVHAEEVANAILAFLRDPKTGEHRLTGVPFQVGDVYELLTNFNASYQAGVVPALPTDMHARLFNILYSHLFGHLMPRACALHTDERGTLFESVRSHSEGQSFISTTVAGAVRGNHYHTHKIERFSVLEGEATIRLRKLFDDHILEYRVSGTHPVYIDMPTFYTHSIENTGSRDVVTSFWTNELYDEEHPDTYPEPVVRVN